MMIEKVTSYGIIMLIENTIIIVLILDLIRRIDRKFKYIKHQHLYWTSGIILLAYLLCILIHNVLEFYTCYVNYLMNNKPIVMETIVARVVSRTFAMFGKIMLWYFTVKGGFNLFKWK